MTRKGTVLAAVGLFLWYGTLCSTKSAVIPQKAARARIMCRDSSRLSSLLMSPVCVFHSQGQMVREQRAHQAAVVKFLAEMEARNKLQLECNKLMVRVLCV